MNRKALIILLTVVISVAFIVTIVWIGKSQPETESENTAIPEEEVYNSIKEVDPARLASLEDNALRAMNLSKSVYIDADKGDANNVSLSDETVSRITDALGAEGLTVIDFDGRVNMKNPEALDIFGRRVNAGENANAAYYVVYSDGHISMNELSYTNGICKQIAISCEWGHDGEPSIYSEGQYTLNSVLYTEKGWLILDRDISNYKINKKFNIDSHTLIRVKPYDETCRQLCEKYISQIGYSENNLFTSTWQESDCSGVDFNCLYPILYGLTYGKDTLIMNTAAALYGTVDNTYLSLVPAEQFEEVIQAFFAVSSEQIRTASDFSLKDNGYYICGFQTGYYNVVPRLPEPEVIDYRFNADGTLTLKVDAVFSWYGTDKAFTHETTIRDTDTGFRYVSNYVYESENNIFPETILRAERQAQMKITLDNKE